MRGRALTHAEWLVRLQVTPAQVARWRRQEPSAAGRVLTPGSRLEVAVCDVRGRPSSTPGQGLVPGRGDWATLSVRTTCRNHREHVHWDGAGWRCEVHGRYIDLHDTAGLSRSEPNEVYAVAPVDTFYAASTALVRRAATSNRPDHRYRLNETRRELREDLHTWWVGMQRPARL